MRRLFKLILVVNAILLVVALPLVAYADPITISITTAALIDIAITAAIGAGISLGIGALVNAIRKPKPGASSTAGLQITTASEGEGLPRIYGTFAVGALVIQRGNVTSFPAQGGGKHRGAANSRYSCDVGFAVCENIEDTILGVSRILVDGEVVYSVDPLSLDGTNPPTLGVLNGPFRKDLMHGRRLQILLGQSTQTTSERDWFSLFGETDDNVPAYRGVVTIWVNDMNFEPLYNRIPQVQVEVVQGIGGSDPRPTVYECRLAGLTASQINVTSDPPFGLGVAIIGPQPYKSLLELSPDVCVAEVDGKLKFMAIPGTSLATVTDGELGAIKTGREDTQSQPVKFAMSIEQSATIPARIEVTYLDPDNKYQQASAGYTRQYGVAQGVTHLQVPIAHTRASAIQYASKLIARSWTERDTLRFNLLPKYVKYHPGDVLTITAPNGQLIDCRILTMDFKAGTHPCEITAVRQLRGQGAGNPSDMLPGTTPDSEDVTPIACVSVLSNVPPLVDDHDTFDGIYWAAGPLVAATSTLPRGEWLGATLYRNACGTPGSDANKVYEAVGITRTTAVIGKARTALAIGSGVDTVNTVDIEVPFGDGTDTIIGTHDDAFTNTTTANLSILGKEVIQFRDVEDVSAAYGFGVGAGRVWRLKGKIKRGIRDTAAFTATHAIGDPFVLYSADSVIRVPVNLDEVGVAFNYKSITHGQEETAVNPIAFTVVEGGATTLKETAP